jgi:2-aminoadipate transaminase
MTGHASTAARWDRILAARTSAGVGEGLASILALSGRSDVISFSGGFPDPATFPGEVLADILRELVDAGDPSAFQYGPTEGLPGLRDFIAQRLHHLDGRRPEAAELIVTSGGIEALELLGKACLDRSDVVLVEGPTFLGAIMAFRSFETEVRAIPIDDEGLRVDLLEAILSRGGRPKLLYTIPDHQNPAGVSLSMERRVALVEVARRHGLLVVEDVAYRELGFGPGRPDSLWALAPDQVVQVGTFSKTFFPGVRLGWAAGPHEVVAELVRAKQVTDQCAGALGQRLLEEYGRRGLLEPQNERARTLYAQRCGLLLDALEREMPSGVTWTRPRGGFFTWLTLPSGVSGVALAERAMEGRVAFVPGPPFYPDGAGDRHLRLAFSRIRDEDVPDGARRLGVLIRAAMEGGI